MLDCGFFHFGFDFKVRLCVVAKETKKKTTSTSYSHCFFKTSKKKIVYGLFLVSSRTLLCTDDGFKIIFFISRSSKTLNKLLFICRECVCVCGRWVASSSSLLLMLIKKVFLKWLAIVKDIVVDLLMSFVRIGQLLVSIIIIIITKPLSSHSNQGVIIENVWNLCACTFGY